MLQRKVDLVMVFQCSIPFYYIGSGIDDRIERNSSNKDSLMSDGLII